MLGGGGGGGGPVFGDVKGLAPRGTTAAPGVKGEKVERTKGSNSFWSDDRSGQFLAPYSGIHSESRRILTGPAGYTRAPNSPLC